MRLGANSVGAVFASSGGLGSNFAQPGPNDGQWLMEGHVDGVGAPAPPVTLPVGDGSPQAKVVAVTAVEILPRSDGTEEAASAVVHTHVRRKMMMFQRFSGLVGVLFLFLGLGTWMFRPGHFRLSLVIMVCAMFLALLHYYSLEDAGAPAPRRPMAKREDA
jgi:hypothetical protein